MAVASLRLPGGTRGDADVRTARQHVREVLRGAADQVVDDAELVVTELVTNALLHGGDGEVRLTVDLEPARLRVVVEDAGGPMPRALDDGPHDGDLPLTGRGLRLVAALASRWGVEPCGDGRKRVWAELDPQHAASACLEALPQWDADALLAAWPDEDEDDAGPVTVHLGAVATSLLLEAEAHVDNVVRELTLATSPGSPHPAAPVLDAAVAAVQGFAGVRARIKEQALAASRAGAATTELVLPVSPTAAQAAERYLAALEDVDRYAAAARMLTLQTPPVHRVLRRWYAGAVLGAATSRTPTAGRSFPDALAEEVTALADLHVQVSRTAGLHRISAAVAGQLTPEEVAAAVVVAGTEVLGASGGGVSLLEGDHLRVLAVTGFDTRYRAILEAASLQDAQLPGPVVLRTGRAVWVESAAERDALFPDLAELEAGTVATCAVPLVAGEVALGVVRFAFDRPTLFDDAERRFVQALADTAALALQRSLLFLAEQQARGDAEDLAHQLDLLMDLTAELGAASTRVDVVETVTHKATSLGAVAARLHLVVEGELVSVSYTQDDPEVRAAWASVPADDVTLPGGAALAAGRPLVWTGLRELEAAFPRLAGVFDSDRTLVVAPLTAAGSPLGILSVTFPGVRPDPGRDAGFVSTLADATAQSLARTLSEERTRAAADKLRFLADASAALSGSLDVATTMTTIAELVVPRIADWCVVHLRDDRTGALVDVAIAHRRPDRVAWARTVAHDYPADPDATTGVAGVLRTGVSELHNDITDEMLQAGAVDERHLGLLREVGMAAVLTVPLTGRHGTFGAISLLSSDRRRRFDPDDVAFVEDLARRAALAAENATSFAVQQGRLAAVTRIAEAAQRAILAPPPDRVGPVTLAARYVGAAAEAQIGGDLYEVVVRPGAVRLLIGDVRGKGLEAVRNATVVLGEFRAAAADLDALEDVAVQLDRRMSQYLSDDEDFVTALLAEIADDGTLRTASCGHPGAVLLRDGAVTALETRPCPPLGLGAAPVVTTHRLLPDDRLLLFTDGLLEARRPDRSFVDVAGLLAALPSGDLQTCLDDLLASLRRATGAALSDDLALLAAGYRIGAGLRTTSGP
ncbi:MAG: hypothetical protein JWN17_2427 [Frankiales bacterium]|nr:hypothetical protein [Frankiales bacterium]